MKIFSNVADVSSTALIAIAGLALTACGTGRADEAAIELETTTVERMDLTSSVAATGTIEPVKVIEVKSQASGEVMEVPVELGDRVDARALLVRINPRDVRNAFDQAEADLEVAQARFNVAARQLERTSNLRESQVVTEEEYEQALLESANTKAGLVKAEVNLELAEDRLNDVVVRAPLSGTIVEKGVEEGAVITGTREVTGGTVLMRMADLNEVQVRTLVDETDIGQIKPGMQASIHVEAYPDRDFNGTVLKIEPQAVVEQGVTMFAVLTRIRNDEDLLRPGMNADVEMVVGNRENVLAIANGAIKTPDEARQLIGALGMDPALLDAKVEREERPRNGGPEGEGNAPDGDGASEAVAPSEAEADEAEADDGLPTMAEIQSMSREERGKLFQSLTPAQRQQMMERGQAARARREAEERANPARPKPGFVFQYDDTGMLTLRPIVMGLTTWESTEIVGGMEEGDVAVKIPMSLVSQAELAERFRSFSSIPGISRN